MEYVLNVGITLVLLVLIIYDCILFTNSVENFGKEYGLQKGAVGGILAAIGTALPETIVPLVAVFGAILVGKNINVGEDIAIGAVLGSPFLLSTVAFFVTGSSVVLFSKLKKREFEMCANPLILIRDLKFFIVSYTVAILCAFIDNNVLKIIIAVLLICYYFLYVIKTLKKDFGCDNCQDDVDALIMKKILPLGNKFVIWIQVILSIVALVLLSHFFVNEIKYFSDIMGIAPLVMSLLIAPVATELPECFNSAIWISSSKDSLSISNITGALVFQSCIPTAIGITLTPWKFTEPAFVSVVLVYLSLIIIYINAIKHKGCLNAKMLMFCGIFYLVYLLYVLKMLI